MANSTLDPQLDPSQLPGDELDPLEKLGYDENTPPTERDLEVEQEDRNKEAAKEQLKEQAKEQLKQKADAYKQEKIAKLKEQLKSGKKAEQEGLGKSGAEGAAKQAGKKTAEQAGEQAAKQAGKEAVAQGAKTVAKDALAEGAEALAVGTSEFWVPILIGIAVIVLLVVLIAVIFGLYCARGACGKGPAEYPTTASQRQEITSLQALTGSQLADNELVAKTVNTVKDRLTTAEATIQKVYASDPAKATAATSDLTSIINSMDAVTAQTDPAQRKTLINNIATELQSYNQKYPEVLGYGAVNGSYLPVPGVTEGQISQCGHASILAVILYYNPSFTDPATYDPATHQTIGADSCVSPSFLSSNTPRKDWTYDSTSHKATEQDVLNSLSGGDPVILYTAEGGIYSNSQHIVVIDGFSPTDKAFIVNSTNGVPGGIQLYTDHPNGHLMTWANIQQYSGYSTYSGHSFIIRGAYLQ